MNRVFLALCLSLLVLGTLSFPHAGEAGAREDARKAYDEQDYDTAFELWKQLASQGDKEAEYAIGVMFALGTGKPRDPVQAFQWFSKAGANGHAKAMFNLGIAYWTGQGTLEDKREAVHWWRKAAERGDAKSQYNLGIAYYNGFGVEKDLVQATRWIRSAAENQYANAQEILPTLEESLRSTQPQQVAVSQPKNSQGTGENQPTTATPEPEPKVEAEVVETEAAAPVEEAAPQPETAAASPEPEAEPQPEPVPVADQELDVDFVAGIIKKDPTEVFAKNEQNAPVIEKLGSGTPVKLEGEKQGWTKVVVSGGLRVWVYGKYVVEAGDGHKINGKGVRARPLPSTAKESVVVGSFKHNDSVELLKTEGKWKQVRAPEHMTGWIKSTNVTRLKKPTQAWMDRWTQLGS